MMWHCTENRSTLCDISIKVLFRQFSTIFFILFRLGLWYRLVTTILSRNMLHSVPFVESLAQVKRLRTWDQRPESRHCYRFNNFGESLRQGSWWAADDPALMGSWEDILILRNVTVKFWKAQFVGIGLVPMICGVTILKSGDELRLDSRHLPQMVSSDCDCWRHLEICVHCLRHLYRAIYERAFTIFMDHSIYVTFTISWLRLRQQ